MMMLIGLEMSHMMLIGLEMSGMLLIGLELHFGALDLTLGDLGLLLDDLLLEGAAASVQGPELVASAAHSVLAHRLQPHAHLQALLEAAVGAALALVLVDLARLCVCVSQKGKE